MVEQALFVGAHVLAVGVTAGLAVYAHRRHGDTRMGTAFAAMAAAFSVWSLGALLRAFAHEPGAYLAVTAFKYLGVGTAPVFFLLVALHFANLERFAGPRWVAGLLVVPAATVLAVATNAWHGLFYAAMETVPLGEIARIETVRGPWFWGFALYGWGLLALGTALLLIRSGMRFFNYRLQSLLIAAGIGIPWAASLAYIFQDWPHPVVDPTPVAFGLATGLFGLAMFRADRFELVTQARGAWFELVEDPVFVLDEHGELVDENPAARTLLASVAGTPRSDGARLPEALRAENLDDGRISFTVQGRPRHYKVEEITLARRGHEGGRVLGLFDVTREHETREELQEALAVERTVLDATADGVLVVDEDGDIVSYNQRFQDLWNIPDQVIATEDDEVLREYVLHQLEDPEAFLERVQALYEDPDRETLDLIRFEDGRIFERYSQPWRMDGQARGRVWSFRDVTEQRRIREQFETLLEAAPDALLVVDEEGTIQLVNEQTEALFGYERGDLLGEPVEVLVPDELRADHVGHREAYIEDPQARPMGVGLDLEGVREDGTRFPVEISLSPLETPEGSRVIAAVRDMTQRREAQTRLRQQTEQLAAMNEKLEHANEDLRSFARVLSHDLKEPLRMVRSYASLLEDRVATDDPEVEEMLAHVERGCQRGLAMIDGLRRVSQVDQADPVVDPVDLDGVLDEVVDTLAARVEQADATVEWDGLPVVYGDRAQIAQVLQNLVSNAIKFHREGVPPVVRVRALDEGERWCRVEVQDNGKGVDPDRADELFAIFERGTEARGEVEGQGVGLALCRKIVERHGGTIEATGTPGEGSVFAFTLPLEEDEARARRPTKPATVV